jgi:hypothetical protein
LSKNLKKKQKQFKLSAFFFMIWGVTSNSKEDLRTPFLVEWRKEVDNWKESYKIPVSTGCDS